MSCYTMQIAALNEKLAELQTRLEQSQANPATLDAIDQEIANLQAERKQLVKDEEDFHALLGEAHHHLAHNDDDDKPQLRFQ